MTGSSPKIDRLLASNPDLRKYIELQYRVGYNTGWGQAATQLNKGVNPRILIENAQDALMDWFMALENEPVPEMGQPWPVAPTERDDFWDNMRMRIGFMARSCSWRAE